MLARELGTNILRQKIFKPETYSARRKQQEKKAESDSNKPMQTQPDDSAMDVVVEDKIEEDESVPSLSVSEKDISMHTCTTVESPHSRSALESEENDSFIASTPLDASTHSVLADDSFNNDSQSTITDSGPEDVIIQSTVSASSTNPTTKPSHSSRLYLSPNEAVYSGSKNYPDLFIFWQLMDWYNAGTDEIIRTSPDLFGTVQLPLPEMCFNASELPYTTQAKEMLIEYLCDEKLQSMSWPKALKDTFSHSAKSSSSQRVLYGSPTLDVALGKVDTIQYILKEFDYHRKKSSKDQNDHSQLDDQLPPEAPTLWVQCEIPTCRKWRRVAWNVDFEKLPDYWTCDMNFWDIENATCQAPQDHYNPDQESTLEYNDKASTEVLIPQIGQWRDVYCVRNRIYYEAQIKDIDYYKATTSTTDATGATITNKVAKRLKFHFKGWNSCFDEWIDAKSDRIVAHNLFTSVSLDNPRQQEKWQGKDLSKTNGATDVDSKKKSTKSKSVATKKSAVPNKKKRNSTGALVSSSDKVIGNSKFSTLSSSTEENTTTNESNKRRKTIDTVPMSTSESFGRSSKPLPTTCEDIEIDYTIEGKAEDTIQMPATTEEVDLVFDPDEVGLLGCESIGIDYWKCCD